MQVIEVRFINPGNGEILADEFTVPPKSTFNAKDHTAMHRGAAELALNAWSGGAGVLKGFARATEAKWTGGGNGAYQYIYDCVLGGPPDDPEDRSVIAVLFTEYKEKDI